MKLRALAVLPLLVGCVNMATVTPVEDVEIPPPGVYGLCTTVTLTASVIEATQKASELCGTLAFACATINPPANSGGHQIVTDAPTSFNDHGALMRLGHEVLHNLGGVHR